MNYNPLYKAINYEFKDSSLLELALTHRSISNKNNERFEYLGDSIVNFVIAEALFHQFPKQTEGQLSRMRAKLVKKETLAQIARQFDLGEFIQLGSGELKSGGYRRESILADAVEAIIAAIYLDSDFMQCKTVILSWYQEFLNTISPNVSNKDPKTELQEYLQAQHMQLPTYSIIRTEGQDHEQRFFIKCEIKALQLCSEGEGSSRRRAEQTAASKLLRELKNGK